MGERILFLVVTWRWLSVSKHKPPSQGEHGEKIKTKFPQNVAAGRFYASENFYGMSSQVGVEALTALFEDVTTFNDTLILCFHEYGGYKEICFIFK